MNHPISSRLLTTAATALLAAGLFAPIAASAGDRLATIHGRNGGLYQRHVSRAPGSFMANGSATLPSGKTASRSFNRQRTETGWTTSARATGFNGRTASFDSALTRTDAGYVRQVDKTGPNGGSVAKQVTVANHGGVVSRSVSSTRTPAHP